MAHSPVPSPAPSPGVDSAVGPVVSPAVGPVVSVVIPTYSHRATIGETLDSVFAQTFRNFEVVVIDDGSTDGTAELLRPLAEQGRIRYVRQHNAGQSVARNRGLHEARGAFIAFLDDDDLWPPDKLEWQVAALRERPEAVLAYGEERQLHPDGRYVRRHDAWPDGEVYAKFRLRNWITTPGQTLIRADTLRAVGGFDAAIWGSDDWDLYIRLAQRGPFVFRPVVAVDYRVHDGNSSRQAVRHALNHLHIAWRHIGWNLPLLVRHQRLAAKYFVPRLMAYAERARNEENGADALAATALALTFLRWRPLRRTILRSVPRDIAAVLRRHRRGGGPSQSRPDLRDQQDGGGT